MHSTLCAELRGTQRVLKLVHPHATRQATNRQRAFSHKPFLREDNNSGRDSPTSRLDQNGSTATGSASTAVSHPSKLGSEIEKWINYLSQNGRSLQVWDTISNRDENGTWRLSSQARKDIEAVDDWARERSATSKTPFGIKVVDGRIRALSTQEFHQEQENGGSSGLVHGPFVSGSDSQQSQRGAQVHSFAGTGAIKPVTELETTTQEGAGDDVSRYVKELSTIGDADVPKYHGSAAARRQRAQRSKEKSSAYTLPSWFSTNNIIPRHNGRISSSQNAQPESNSDASNPSPKSRMVLWHSESHSLSEQPMAREPQRSERENSEIDKENTMSTGGDENSSSGNPDTPSGAKQSSNSSPILVPLANSTRSYAIEEAQHNELMTSAKGRLRPPASGSLDTRPGGIRGHLIIHFAAPDGEIFLDHLVEDMATRLDCNLIALDAQDISSLIIPADVDSFVKYEAAMLGYEVYGEVYKDESPEQDTALSGPGEDAEDVEEDFGPPTPQGMPFMVGKPITIDLKALFSSKPHRRGSSMRASNIMPDVFGPSSSNKASPPLFASMIDSMLSGARAKSKTSSPEGSASDEQIRSQKEPTIVHIKDLRAIQDVHIGKQFLMQLYEQVERRRAGGESIMLVGTECSKESRASYDSARINSLQASDQEEISSTLVVTPVEAQGNDDFSADRARRLQIINARHLWQMLQSKNLTLDSLQPGFWNGDRLQNIHAADAAYLEKNLWTFGHVQRLAAILASSDYSGSHHPIAEAAAVIEISDNSKYTWARQGRKDSASGDAKRSGVEKSDRLAKIREKANKHEKKLLSGVVEPKKIATTFNDIHIPQDTIDSLQTLTTLSLVRPDAFKYGVLASDRIPGLLLYGPPGTGKTLAAKAVARESGATMLEVSSADINDMYVGEGEKNVKALFSLARKLSPCVVFLDEADAMFSARSAQGRRVSHRELLNQFLKEWDGMSNDSGSAFIMVATNRPMDLDDAVLRRLPRRLLIDLPTESDRLEILKIHLRHEQIADDVNLTQIATKTPFYSGSDLKNLAVSAALNAVREENAEAKARAGDGQSPEYPEKRTLAARHFDKALEEISASISEDMSSLRDIKKFDEQYGDRKGRKRKSPRWGFKTAAEADAVLDTVKVRS